MTVLGLSLLTIVLANTSVPTETIQHTANKIDSSHNSNSPINLDNPETIKSLRDFFDNDTPFDAFQKLINVFLSVPTSDKSQEFPISKLCGFWLELQKTPPFNSPTDLEWQIFLSQNKQFIDKILFGLNNPTLSNCGTGYLAKVSVKSQPGTKHQGKNLQLVLRNIDPGLKEQDPPELTNPVSGAKYFFNKPQKTTCKPQNTPCYMLSVNLNKVDNLKETHAELDRYTRPGGYSFSNYVSLVTGENLTSSGRYKHGLEKNLSQAKNSLERTIKALSNSAQPTPEQNKALLADIEKYRKAQSRFVEANSHRIVSETQNNLKNGTTVEAYKIELDPANHPTDNSSNELFYNSSDHFSAPTMKFLNTTIVKNPSGNVLYINNSATGFHKGNKYWFGFGVSK